MRRQDWLLRGLAGSGALLLTVALGGVTFAAENPETTPAGVEPVPLHVDRVMPDSPGLVAGETAAPLATVAETKVSTFQVEPLPVTRVMPAAIPPAGVGPAQRTPALSSLKVATAGKRELPVDFTSFVSHSDKQSFNVRPAILTRPVADSAATDEAAPGGSAVQQAVIDGDATGTAVQTVGYRRFYSPWRYSSYGYYGGYPYYRSLYRPRYYYSGYYGWGFPWYRSYYYGNYSPTYTSWYYQPYAAYAGYAYSPVIAYSAAYVGAYGYGSYGYGGYYGGYCGW